MIPDVAYYNDNRQGEVFELLDGADGVGAGHGAGDAHGHSSLERGFNLREVELAFSGSVDPYFDVWATFAVGADGIDTEEAYVQTRKFLPGVQLRVGTVLQWRRLHQQAAPASVGLRGSGTALPGAPWR